MALTIATITDAVTENYPETVTTSRMNRAIARAVQKYSGYNPRVLSTTISLVADDYEYALPTAFLGLVTERWWPLTDDNLSAYLRLTEEAYPVIGRSRQVSMTTIEKIIRGDYFGRTCGLLEVRGDYLYVSPTPSSAESIVFIYYAYHVINAGGTGYDTLPAADIDIMADLTIMRLMDSRSIDAAMTDSFGEGTARINPRGVVPDIFAVQEKLLESVRAKYSRPVVE
jgi:hypothetical protein